MKIRYFVFILALTLTAGAVLTGCGKPDGSEQESQNDDNKEVGVKGSETSFGDVTLTDIIMYPDYFVDHNFHYGTWDGSEISLETEGSEGKLFIIRCEEDFEKYSIIGRDRLPEVDFEEGILCLMHGATNYGISTIGKSIRTEVPGEYILTAEITHNIACVCPVWRTAVFISGLPEGALVELEITRTTY